jgi:thiaminase
MRFFERLKAAASAESRVYSEHPFTNGMADGLLAEAAIRHYLAAVLTRAASQSSSSDHRRSQRRALHKECRVWRQ